MAKGSVVGTDPAIGSRVGKGSTVLLIVSAGPHMIAVPQVTGSTLATAEASLRHAGLIPGKVLNQTSTTIQSGIVISTTPASGVSWPQTGPSRSWSAPGSRCPTSSGRTRP